MNETTYGDCSYCGGLVSPKLIEKICTRNDRLLAIINGVPAGVCDQCGERYYKAPIAKQLRRQLATLKPNSSKIEVPNIAFTA